jgi:glutamate/aspartate transport system ATP-binding protein
MIEINHVRQMVWPEFSGAEGLHHQRAKGEVVVRPSGSGKSTLIKCVNALEPIRPARSF